MKIRVYRSLGEYKPTQNKGAINHSPLLQSKDVLELSLPDYAYLPGQNLSIHTVLNKE